jgi:methionyl-tRNA formyltransferase
MNALELHDELAKLGADLLQVELMDYVRGNLAPVPQDESQVTIAKKIDKAESQVDWSTSAKATTAKSVASSMGRELIPFLTVKN